MRVRAPYDKPCQSGPSVSVYAGAPRTPRTATEGDIDRHDTLTPMARTDLVCHRGHRLSSTSEPKLRVGPPACSLFAVFLLLGGPPPQGRRGRVGQL